MASKFNTPSPDNVMLGRGALFVDLFENGVKTGERHFGNVTALSLSIEDETRKLYESMTAASSLYKEVTVQRNISCSITGSEFSPENVAIVLAGVGETVATAAGTVTDEQVAAAPRLGRWYVLAHRNVSDVVLKAGSVTFEEGIDYDISAARGRIYVDPAGEITDLEPLTASYSYAKAAVAVIEGGTAGTVEAALRFIGDPAAGPKVECYMPRVKITPSGEFGFISDDFGAWQLTASVLTQPGSAPFTLYYQ